MSFNRLGNSGNLQSLANIGDGSELYSETTGGVAQIRTLEGAGGITVSESSDEVTISGSATPSFTNLTVAAGGAGLDTTTAGALNLGTSTATSVVITPATTVTGGVKTNSVDRISAGALAIGASTATSVVITPATTVTGGVLTNSIDRITAGTLSIGTGTANGITIGSASAATTFAGPQTVNDVVEVKTNNATPLHVHDNSSGTLLKVTQTTVEVGRSGAASPAMTTRFYNSAGGETCRVTGSNGNVTLAASAVIDTFASGSLNVGTATANALNLSRSGVNTAVAGTLSVAQQMTYKTKNVYELLVYADLTRAVTGGTLSRLGIYNGNYLIGSSYLSLVGAAGPNYDTFTCPTTGTYKFQLGGCRCGSGSGTVQVTVKRAAATIFDQQYVAPIVDCSQFIQTVIWNGFQAGDTVTFQSDESNGISYPASVTSTAVASITGKLIIELIG